MIRWPSPTLPEHWHNRQRTRTRPGPHACPLAHSRGYFHQSGTGTSSFIDKLEHACYPAFRRYVAPLSSAASGRTPRPSAWFQPRSRRRIALRRIAERLAYEDSHGYDYKYERFLEHYFGGRDWHEEWKKADTPDGNRGFYDSRGPAPKWWQRRRRG